MGQIIIGIIIGCVSAAFGGYLAFVASEHTRRIQEFNKAAATFKNAFLEQIVYLKGELADESTPEEYNTDLCTFLRSNMLDSLRAIENFKPYLSVQERIGIEQAWNNYCHHGYTPQNAYEKRKMAFIEYFTIENDEAAGQLAMQWLMGLLSFAHFK